MCACLVGLLLTVSPIRSQTPGAARFAAGEQALAAGDPWQARGEFERALREGYPEGIGFHALTGAYLALDNRLFDARAALERALAAQPDSTAWWYLLGDINLRLDGGDADSRSRTAFREVFLRDPFHEDAWEAWQRLYLDPSDLREVEQILAAHLARAYDPELALRRIDLLYDVGDFDAAWEDIERFQRTVKDERLLARLSYLAGVVLAARGDPESGAGYYFNGLAFAPTSADLEPYYADVSPLLPKAEREAWSAWSIERQRDFLQGFWNARDPLPFGGGNERWVEQQRRIRVARDVFRWKKPIQKEKLIEIGAGADLGMPSIPIRLDGRPLDDRGALYLRHGDPDDQAGLGLDECGFWYYDREGLPGDGSVAFNFTREREEGRAFYGNDCVVSTLPTTGKGLQHFAPGVGGLEPWDVLPARERVLEDLAAGLSSDSYRMPIEHRIPVDATAAGFDYFREGTDVALYFAIPLPEITVQAEHTRYRKGLVLYDSNWQEVARQSEQMDAVVAHGYESEGSAAWYLVDLFRVHMTPGSYHYALQIDDLQGDGVGIEKGTLRVRRFSETGLDLSDPVLSARVSEGGGAPRFQRYGRTILPLPSRRFLQGQPLFLYFEIYNLRPGAGGDLRFRVDYAIEAEALDRNTFERFFGAVKGLAGVREESGRITFSFEREVEETAGGVVPEHVSFDATALAPGVYTLQVTVTDLAFLGRSAHVTESFTIVD